ncbi:ester cyclase [Amnibacterium sp. CER49]|uniref:ester cyclase n=1 Tax=Amnibacterium sp. CER49 TaxID=3039161 RepID=UPI00244A5323|nr:ester cyclase [Amnibacterium sp. CER49]MDH2444570.1 ester cyclase [Amnibacterium sp. CER49]
MSPAELRLWYEDYLDTCNRHDLDGLRDLLAPDVRRAHLPRGADAWLGDLDALFAAFPDYQWKRITLVVEGDRIAAHLRARGTHRGAFRGIPATGRHVNAAEFGFYRVERGRIVEFAGTADDAELLARLR